MRKIYIIFILFLIALGSCNKEELTTPSAEFDYYVVREGQKVYSPDEVDVGEVIVFVSTGSGDYFAVYPGDEGNEYSATVADSILNDTLNRVSLKGSGWALTKIGSENRVSFKYKTQGEYTIVFVASSSANFGEDRETVYSSGKTIQVYDRATDLKVTGISATSYFDKEKLEYSETGDTIYLMTKYTTTDFKMRLKINVGNATLSRNGKAVKKPSLDYRDEKISYEEPVVYLVTAADGMTTREYTFIVKKYDRVLSTNASFESITIGSAEFLIDATSNYYLLSYPTESTDEIVELNGLDKFVSYEIGGTKFSSSDELTVADLIDNSVIVVIPEEGEPQEYRYSIDEEVLSILDFKFVYPEAVGLPFSTDKDADTVNVNVIARESLWKSVDSYNVIFDFGSYYHTAIKSGENIGSLTDYKNKVDTVDITAPVLFQFNNGTKTEYYRFSVEKK